jgi:hypothetical protein
MRACFQKWGSLHNNVVKFQKSNKDKMDSFTCKIIFTILANIPETLHDYPYPNIENVEKENEKDASMEKMSNPQKSFRGSTHAWNLRHMHDILCNG